MASKKQVTVVNDHPEFLALMAEFLTEEGYEVTAIPKHQGAFTTPLIAVIGGYTLGHTAPLWVCPFAVYSVIKVRAGFFQVHELLPRPATPTLSYFAENCNISSQIFRFWIFQDSSPL